MEQYADLALEDEYDDSILLKLKNSARKMQELLEKVKQGFEIFKNTCTVSFIRLT